MWETQRSYGNPKGQKHRSKNWTTKPYKRNMRDIRGWNCNKKGHYVTNCPKVDKTMTQTVHQALKRSSNTAEKILF